MFHKETWFNFFFFQLSSFTYSSFPGQVHFPELGLVLFLSLLFSHFGDSTVMQHFGIRRAQGMLAQGFFPQPRWIKICHRQCPSRLLGASQQAQPSAALSQSGEMILIKNRINKQWARLLSQSLEPCILKSGAKFILGASAVSYIFPLVKCKSKTLEL